MDDPAVMYRSKFFNQFRTPHHIIRMMVELMLPTPDEGQILTPDGLRVVCAGLDNDPEKIGIHMLEMLANFRNGGIVE